MLPKEYTGSKLRLASQTWPSEKNASGQLLCSDAILMVGVIPRAMAPGAKAPRKQLITVEAISEAFERGAHCVAAPASNSIVTPAAWSRARELGVQIDRDAKAVTFDRGGCERVVDQSGVVVVRGESVTLGRFAAAGADRNVGLVDVITRQQGAPMSAGFMSFGRTDAFSWRLDYDEIDYVIEGVLHITIDGRVLEGQPGDVMYVPKGTNLIFGTPKRARVFYVTYPAEWAQPP